VVEGASLDAGSGTNFCWSCLGDLFAPDRYHVRCLLALFGTKQPPELDINLAKFHTAALAMAGHVSLSGNQRKLSLSLSADRKTLQVSLESGQYILKPQAQTFPALPENEHVTRLMAGAVGIEVPRCALIELTDGSRAYIVERFDRPRGGRKLRQEDFCQLAEISPKQKYDGSAELCARLVRRFASEPLVEMLKLLRQLYFAWWVGNGDLHLKNLSLLAGGDDIWRLSPAYDALATHLVLPDDPLALPVGGKRSNVGLDTWLAFARYCDIPTAAALRVMREPGLQVLHLDRLVDRSALPQDQKVAQREHLAQRTAMFTSANPSLP